MDTARRKRQITASESIWARVSGRAKEMGLTESQVLVRAFDEWDTHGRYEPLSKRAHVSPLVTGDRMLAALLHEGSVELACVKLGTTLEEWRSVVPGIPGLEQKIRLVFGERHGL